MQSRPRWMWRVVPGCPPGPDSRAAGEIDLELTPDRVADASLERAERFLLGFAFSNFAVVVDAAQCVVRDLGDRDEMHRVVQFAVPAGVERVPDTRPAGRFDRRGAVVGREPRSGCESVRVTDVSEDQPGDDRPDPMDLDQRRFEAATAAAMRAFIATTSRS